MKITKSQLRQIIKEEITRVLLENDPRHAEYRPLQQQLKQDAEALNTWIDEEENWLWRERGLDFQVFFPPDFDENPGPPAIKYSIDVDRGDEKKLEGALTAYMRRPVTLNNGTVEVGL
tara:strand:+ start:60 stop:413 length:354 start_codon:yes stop_codon:yes gene_type:complete